SNAPGEGPGEPSASADTYAARLGPESFPGVRFGTARFAIAVVALDSRGRRSPPRPIVEIDPIEPPLPPPESFTATPSPEGVRLGWTLPKVEPGAGPARVNVYRGEPDAASGPAGRANPAPASGNATGEGSAVPAMPLTPIAGSPFPGESALD